MKEIGLSLKAKREENGVTVEEAAEDLKLRPSQIRSIEEGKIEDFKDVFYLKYFIRDYAKYLGLDGSKLVDQFNEFLFDYTSKISIEDVKKKQDIIEDKATIHSPYTKKLREPLKLSSIIPYVIIIIVAILIAFIVL